MLSQAIVGLRRLRVQRHLAHISSKRNFSHGDGSGQGSSGGGANGARCVLVTGAASGIGLACACLLAEQGWRVALADCIETSGRKAAARIRELHPKSEARFYRLDVRDEAQTEETVSKALLDFGQLDGAIANAGVVFQKPFLETSTEEFKRVVDVNLLGAFLTGRTVARAMVAQGTGGAIVNMSSVNASLVIPGMTGYVASKGGLQQLTRLMAIELSPYSIRVNAIAPGSVGTEMAYATYRDPEPVVGLGLTKKQLMLARTPIGRMAEPREIAAIASFLLSTDSSYVTGETIVADGGRAHLNGAVPIPHGMIPVPRSKAKPE